MDYLKNYNDYILYVKNLNRSKKENVYYELHHIIPKCLGGDNSSNNLILLTAREHFLAHYLLTKIHPDNYKIAYAFIIMKATGSYKKQQRYINSRLYESIKVNFSILARKNMLGKTPWNKGKKETRLDVLDKISKTSSGRKWTEEQKKNKKVTIAKLIENGSKYGKPKGHKPYNLGKIWMRLNEEVKYCFPEEIEFFLNEGWEFSEDTLIKYGITTKQVYDELYRAYDKRGNFIYLNEDDALLIDDSDLGYYLKSKTKNQLFKKTDLKKSKKERSKRGPYSKENPHGNVGNKACSGKKRKYLNEDKTRWIMVG